MGSTSKELVKISIQRPGIKLTSVLEKNGKICMPITETGKVTKKHSKILRMVRTDLGAVSRQIAGSIGAMPSSRWAVWLNSTNSSSFALSYLGEKIL